MSVFIIFLFFYGGLLVFIIKLPARYWDFFLAIFDHLKKYRSLAKSHFPLLFKISAGQDLLISIGETLADISFGRRIIPGFLPEYKFYTSLLEQLFKAHRELGVGINKIIPEIRTGLIGDLQFEKKILDETMGALLQFLVVLVTTFSFVYLSSLLIALPLNKIIISGMIGLQIVGATLFFYLMNKIKKKMFDPFFSAIFEIYLFRSFLEIGLPLNDLLAKSGIANGSFIKYKIFDHLSQRMNRLINRLKEVGISPKDEVQEIIGEIWHLQDEAFLKFSKIVIVLKFFILAGFFLPAYFLYLFSIFQFFMEQ